MIERFFHYNEWIEFTHHNGNSSTHVYRLIFEMQLQNKKLFNLIYIFADKAESTWSIKFL